MLLQGIVLTLLTGIRTQPGKVNDIIAILGMFHVMGLYLDFWKSIIVDKEKFKNIHWDPQSDFCGLKKFYPLFNFVGTLAL